MSSDAVTVDSSGPITTVTLNDPDKRNALSADVRAGLSEAFDGIDDGDTRCVVVQGADDAFCAGGDVSRMRDRIGSGKSPDELMTDMRRTHEAVRSIATCRLPVVALVDGPAIGAGASLALACDVQLASERTVVGFGFRNVGLSIDSGGSHMLPKLVGENVAKELVFTGKVLDAERAADLGLLNRVFPTDEFEDRSWSLVEKVASGPTVALCNSKQLLEESPSVSLDEAMANEVRAQFMAYQTDDYVEGVEAFFDRRDPEFQGR